MASESGTTVDCTSTALEATLPAARPAILLDVGSDASDYERCNLAMRHICGPYRLECPRWWQFRGGVRNFDVAALNVTDIQLSDGSVIRDSRGDAYYRGDCYSLVLQVGGTARMWQRGIETVLRPGDCTLIDSRLPSVFRIVDGTHQYSFNFRAELIDDRFGRNADLVCRRISGYEGAGAILANTLRSIICHAQTLTRADLVETALHLLAAATGRGRNATVALATERSTLSAREITEYVDSHVDDATLTPQDIANHFNVSLRQLYRITASANCTPAALIWQRRLQRAHELLARSPHLPITEIAYGCGFKDGAHFSRSYRKAFGQAPRLARRTATASAGITV